MDAGERCNVGRKSGADRCRGRQRGRKLGGGGYAPRPCPWRSPDCPQVLIHPATDMTRAHESHQRNGEGDLLTRRSIDWFLGHDLPSGHDLRDPEASPLATDFHDLPPVALVTAGFDPLLDEGHTYGEKLKESGVAVSERCGEGMMHGFITSRGLMPQANECLNWIVAEVGALTTSSLK